MRKRPILFAIAASTAGLAVLGTVVAQSPVAPALPTQPIRSAAEWTSTPQQPGFGGPVNRPRLTSPVAAGPNGVTPVSYNDLPPPNMEMPAARPGPAGLPTAPPSLSQEPREAKFPPTPSTADVQTLPAPPQLLPQAGGLDPRPPLVPPIPAPTNPTSPQPIPIGPTAPLPVTPGRVSAPIGVPTHSVVPMPGSDTTVSAGPGAIRSFPMTTAAIGLSNHVTQTVTLEAICPESVVFGGEFRYELVVKNVGGSPVNGVRVEDELPIGAKYIGSEPPAELYGDRLAWTIGTLEGAAEKRLTVRLKMTEEGEVRSRAAVTYSASVEARTKVTRPRIGVSVIAADVCKAGEETIFQVKVSNTGSGPAEKVILQAKLTDGLIHERGAVIEAALTNLAANESKTLPLKVTASKAGAQLCQITVAAQGSPDAIAKAMLNVVEPLLQIVQTGPAKCLVRAEPTYEITLSNPGTVATDAVALYSVLPEGFEFVQASDNGTYSNANRTVVWRLPGIVPGTTKSFSLKLHAAAAGDCVLRTIAQAGNEAPATIGAGGAPAPRPAGRVLEANAETAIKGEGLAAVRFEVKDLEDPVEVGKEALYEIRVTNQGTGVCTNVQLLAALAEGTTFMGFSGPTQVKAQGQTLVFDPIVSLPVKGGDKGGDVVYTVKVRATTPGDHRFRVQLSCDQVRTPVVKEESTWFYKE